MIYFPEHNPPAARPEISEHRLLKQAMRARLIGAATGRIILSGYTANILVTYVSETGDQPVRSNVDPDVLQVYNDCLNDHKPNMSPDELELTAVFQASIGNIRAQIEGAMVEQDAAALIQSFVSSIPDTLEGLA